MLHYTYKTDLELVRGGNGGWGNLIKQKKLSFVIPVRSFQIFFLEITINQHQNVDRFHVVQRNDPQILVFLFPFPLGGQSKHSQPYCSSMWRRMKQRVILNEWISLLSLDNSAPNLTWNMAGEKIKKGCWMEYIERSHFLNSFQKTLWFCNLCIKIQCVLNRSSSLTQCSKAAGGCSCQVSERHKPSVK